MRAKTCQDRATPDYSRTVAVTAAPDAAFELLSDPRNLPRYVATMTEAEPEAGDELHVTADVEGRREEGDAHFSADAESRSMKWSAPGSDYNGSLGVAPSGDGSTVTIRIHVVREVDEAEIDRALDETAANIERLLS